MRPGAHWTADSTRFRLWAPSSATAAVHLEADGRLLQMSAREAGWFELDVDDLPVDARYRYRLDDGVDRPDPASLSQPEGVHGPSAVVDLTHPWTDADWVGRPLEEQVLYELHVGTFTSAGTLAAAAERLGHLVGLGVTTVELMPLAQFPGSRNWGYDGVDLYAVQDTYGGPRALQSFVDASHALGISVILDVVYNHLGPEGNHLHAYGPYFTDRYRTPWGEAVNLDGRGSDEVRAFLVENALMWVTDFHVDGLRLDAVHAMFDRSARPFLAELTEALHRRSGELGRPVHVIAENALNDPRVLRPPDVGGLALDAAWNDDFHHALHVTLTGETSGYYVDFAGAVTDLATAISDGYVEDGRYSEHRGHRHGAPSSDLPRTSLVVFAQNHDQVGNRARGDRLTSLVDPAAARLAAAITLLSPWLPMLFMGEEWGEDRPFLYFVDHGDPALLEAVRTGRAAEFEGLIDPSDAGVPDPGDPGTRQASILDWEAARAPEGAARLLLHTELIAARRDHPSLRSPLPQHHAVERRATVVEVRGTGGGPAALARFNVSASPAAVDEPRSGWRRVLDGSERRFGGEGPLDGRLGPWGFDLLADGPGTGDAA